MLLNSVFNDGFEMLSQLRRDTEGLPSLLNTVFGKPKTLHQDLKEEYTTPEVQQIRIPQQEWADGAPPLGTNGLL